VSADNPLLAVQKTISDQIVAGLDAYRVARDGMIERSFFGLYGSPMVQAFLGLTDSSEVRPPPVTSPDKLAQQRIRRAGYAAKVASGSADEALIRAAKYVLGAGGALDERRVAALKRARQNLTGVPLATFKSQVREQGCILEMEPVRAIDALPAMVPEAGARRDLLARVGDIVTAGVAPDAGERDRLARLVKLLPVMPGRLEGPSAMAGL
jgi:hypothetical protein